MTNNKTVFQCGNYQVIVSDGQYVIRCVTTGVDEHSSRVLYEAIRFAKIFDASVKQAINEPVENGWGKQQPEEQMEMDFDGRLN